MSFWQRLHLLLKELNLKMKGGIPSLPAALLSAAPDEKSGYAAIRFN
ncbi:hypothetical protein [Pedobacter ureilyticus]|jgi:hypothetical protein|uniref:Uncharacterized protein n=1 Tax=Pedobacter ureilyticus TaxID=1393051 RepID=A0ABW9J3S8_9SPHI|nr:hypothetical protein [Pedobacter helvus]